MLGVKRRHMFWSGACVGQFSISPRQLSSLVGEGRGERGANTPFDTTSAEAASLLRWFSAVGRKCDIIVTQMNAQLILPRRGKLSRAANRRRTAECAKRRNGPPITMWAIHSQTYQLLANY